MQDRIIVLNKVEDRIWITAERFILHRHFIGLIPKGFSVWRVAGYNEAYGTLYVTPERQKCRGQIDFDISSEANSEQLNFHPLIAIANTNT